LDEAEAERMASEHEEMLWCCFGAANGEDAHDSLTHCTCWEPIFDLEQAPPNVEMEATTRETQCLDCAFRHESPEYINESNELERSVKSGVFYCHQGMRRPKVWRHPCGAEVIGDPADYAPPIQDSIPYRADGSPAEKCAGWETRHNAATWDGQRKFFDELSERVEDWQGIPIPLPDLPVVLNDRHPLREFFRDYDGTELQIHVGGPSVDAEEPERIVNHWFSRKENATIFVYHKGGKAFAAKEFCSPDQSMNRLDLWLTTIGASDAWDLDAEYKAREKLKGMLTERQWRQYDLTGSFLESSKRSGLMYVFRRLRPTIALSLGTGYIRPPRVQCLDALHCGYKVGLPRLANLAESRHQRVKVSAYRLSES
jgi:hypothetical protein